MNPTFLAANLSNMQITGSHAPVSGGRFENLLDYRTDTFWQSSQNGTQTLSFFMTGSGFDAFGLLGQNFDELFEVGSPTITLKSSTNAAFTLSTQSLCTLSASSDPQVYTFTPTSQRYFRIEFSGTVGAPRIGELYLGTAFTLDHYLIPFRVENVEAETGEGLTLSGRFRNVSRRDARVRASVRFDFIPEASRSAFISLFETTAGRVRPFFFRTAEGVTRFVRFMADYQPLDLLSNERNSTQTIEMKTQGTSTLWTLQGPNSTGSAWTPEIGPLPDWKHVVSVS